MGRPTKFKGIPLYTNVGGIHANIVGLPTKKKVTLAKLEGRPTKLVDQLNTQVHGGGKGGC